MKALSHIICFSLLTMTLSFVQADYMNAQSHLLLSEVVLTPAEVEYIEIYNPTDQDVDLNSYFLADFNEYHFLPGKYGNGPEPVLGIGDFLVQFPPSSVIEANSTLVVALDGDAYDSYFGSRADYEIMSTDPNTFDMLIEELSVEAVLSNIGEGIVLFYWDGTSDLVMDVDMVNVGMPETGLIANKTGSSVDGPDLGTQPSFYLDDSYTMPIQAGIPGDGFSTKRIRFEEANETHEDGNGISGDDETTENILVTWDTDFSPPTPNVVNVNLGIFEVTANSLIVNAYPNPASQEVNIQINEIDKGVVLTLYLENSAGESLERREMRVENKPFITTVNVESYPKGLYLIHIVSDSGTGVIQIIIQ